MMDEVADMNTKADKAAGIALGVMFLCLGIGMLFALPENWTWFQKALFELVLFGSSLLSFMLGVFGLRTPGD